MAEVSEVALEVGAHFQASTSQYTTTPTSCHFCVQGRDFLLARQKDFPVWFTTSNPFTVVNKLSNPGRRW